MYFTCQRDFKCNKARKMSQQCSSDFSLLSHCWFRIGNMCDKWLRLLKCSYKILFYAKKTSMGNVQYFLFFLCVCLINTTFFSWLVTISFPLLIVSFVVFYAEETSRVALMFKKVSQRVEAILLWQSTRLSATNQVCRGFVIGVMLVRNNEPTCQYDIWM